MLAGYKKIVILGSGAWGRALGKLFCYNCPEVYSWSRKSTTSLAETINNADILVSAVSVSGLYPTLEQLNTLDIPMRTLLVTATKGLDPITTKTPSQIWQEHFPKHSIIVLSGPNLSKEIEQGLPAAAVVSSHNLEAARIVQIALSSELFRVYVNLDPLGTELGGTLKNVMAIAAGVCDGLHLGTNAKAALLTRALPEMIRVGSILGTKMETFFGLSGLGDLLATCNSPLSRNYQVGYQLAQGYYLEEILAKLEGTAEGINTTKVLMQIAKQQNLDLPISNEVYRLLSGEITPQESVKLIMERDLKSE